MQVPGAGDAHEFWRVLRDADETITFYSDDELRALGVGERELADPKYVKARGRLEGTEGFDTALFGIAPAEIEATSPQLRLLYECFWHACEDAGYDPTALPGRVGVFAGGNDDFHWYREALLDEPDFGTAYQNFTLATNHFLSTRLAYRFDLTGPALSVLAGCSTSLLTVHLAAQSLRAGECEMAIAGGVTLQAPNDGGYRYADGMMLSVDGHLRPFDAAASGTVFSNGAALVVLKRLEAALRDGDPVYGVIKGSAVGNDGGRKLSYTAPSEDGQVETIRAAYERAGIDPATVSYVEAHGTGTLLGDPVEVASLTRVFAELPSGACTLGSVKSNLGHTDSAAGAVGLAKVAMSLAHRWLPGTLHFDTPNPNIDFAATPFAVTAEGAPWRGERLRAGINSFGVGGTNVHMIVEEAPPVERRGGEAVELLEFSAATPDALRRNAVLVLRHLVDHPGLELADAAETLRNGRARLAHRTAIAIARDEPRDLDAWLARLDAAGSTTALRGSGTTALLFSGQGNQHHRMGYGLYRSRGAVGEVYRRWFDELIGHLPAADGAACREILFGEAEDPRINRTEWSQFALFATQFATAKVLESFGVKPDVLLGHSIGELVAAALAGVWSLGDAALLVRRRGLLMQQQPAGVMMAVTAPADRIREVVEGMPGVWVSLENSAERSVLGMTEAAVEAVVDRLEAAGIRGRRLHTQQAFHTPMMDEAAAEFELAVSRAATCAPKTPIIANRTGQLVAAGEMTDPRYWSDHITGAVRFSRSLETLLSPELLGDEPLYGIELGPGRSLTSFAAHDPRRTNAHRFVQALRHPIAEADDEAHLLGALGELWSAGLELDWSGRPAGRRVSLPGYAFDKRPVNRTLAGLGAERPASTPARPAPARPAALPAAAPSGEGDAALKAAREAFTRVLGYERIAPDADFFDLGGDSLKATVLVAELRALTGVELAVADVFAAPTPTGLAARLGDVAPPPPASSCRRRPRPTTRSPRRSSGCSSPRASTPTRSSTTCTRRPASTAGSTPSGCARRSPGSSSGTRRCAPQSCSATASRGRRSPTRSPSCRSPPARSTAPSRGPSGRGCGSSCARSTSSAARSSAWSSSTTAAAGRSCSSTSTTSSPTPSRWRCSPATSARSPRADCRRCASSTTTTRRTSPPLTTRPSPTASRSSSPSSTAPRAPRRSRSTGRAPVPAPPRRAARCASAPTAPPACARSPSAAAPPRSWSCSPPGAPRSPPARAPTTSSSASRSPAARSPRPARWSACL